MSEMKKKKGLGGFFAVVAVLSVLVVSTFGAIKSHLNLGLDLQGGFEILYEVSPLNEGSDIDLSAVTNSIQKRVNVLGVSEPMISTEGSDRIRVQLAGVADPDAARKMIGTTANLTFRDTDDNELSDASIVQEGGASLAYQDGKPIVSLKIADSAKFGSITKTIASKGNGENIMIIWLDYEEGDSYRSEAAKAAAGEEPKYISAASVQSQISGDCIIQGNFTAEEATTLANLINSGSLPVKMKEISSNVVSAQYGEEALAMTARAGLIGIAAVFLLMLYLYRMPGIIAGIMLVAYIWSIFGLYALMGAVFTLPAIGALVLGVGMTVDANIITYERIRQELYKGHSIRSAVSEGQKLSFSSIFDAQFTTLIAALIMYWWGNGAVKGFATMLIITVVMTLLLNVAMSRKLLNMVVASGAADQKPEWFGVSGSQIPDVSKGEEQFYFGLRRFDFVKSSKKMIMGAVSVLVLAIAVSGYFGSTGKGFMNLGIDFTSGTKLTVNADHPITISEVDTILSEQGYTGFTYQMAGDSTVYATTKQSIETEDLARLKAVFLEKTGQEPGDNIVTPIVGRELVHNALILTLVAWVAMLIYVTVRYEWDYAVSCLAALIHDVGMTLAVFGILRFEINTELISVLLTVIGYSINNSIVVFDRIREMMALQGNDISEKKYKDIVNDALNRTFGMSLFSSVSTILPVIFLLIIGSKAIFSFTFAMFVGLIAGTLSSLFIAPGMWLFIRRRTKNRPKKKQIVRKESLDEITVKGINA